MLCRLCSRICASCKKAVVDTYTACALESGRRKAAADSQRALVGIFKQRDVVDSAIKRAETRLQTLQ